MVPDHCSIESDPGLGCSQHPRALGPEVAAFPDLDGLQAHIHPRSTGRAGRPPVRGFLLDWGLGKPRGAPLLEVLKWLDGVYPRTPIVTYTSALDLSEIHLMCARGKHAILPREEALRRPSAPTGRARARVPLDPRYRGSRARRHHRTGCSIRSRMCGSSHGMSVDCTLVAGSSTSCRSRLWAPNTTCGRSRRTSTRSPVVSSPTRAASRSRRWRSTRRRSPRSGASHSSR